MINVNFDGRRMYLDVVTSINCVQHQASFRYQGGQLYQIIDDCSNTPPTYTLVEKGDLGRYIELVRDFYFEHYRVGRGFNYLLITPLVAAVETEGDGGITYWSTEIGYVDPNSGQIHDGSLNFEKKLFTGKHESSDKCLKDLTELFQTLLAAEPYGGCKWEVVKIGINY